MDMTQPGLRQRAGRILRTALSLSLALGAACHRAPTLGVVPAPVPRVAYTIVPAPTSVEISPRDSFLVTPRTTVYVDAGASPEVEAIGTFAASLIASRAGAVAQRLAAATVAPDSSISLTLDPSRVQLGAEGYELTVTRTRAQITAAQPAGLFYGVQTLRELLPASVEHQAATNRRLVMPAVHIVDTPRFAWRGVMLDVARHFLPPADVKHFIDVLALYKVNRLHLHLADDQGWRIEIKSWPNLTIVGSTTAVGGAPGGFYTQAEYADLVAYARSHYITIVPEIDMPGHINAALVSYPELRCNRVQPAPFTIVGGPPNTLCVERDSVYTFVAAVVGEIMAAAPTPYFHIGGDEVSGLTKEQYVGFINRVQKIVDSIGPRMVGWADIAPANLLSSTIAQHWNRDSVILQVARGGKVILSPGPHAYLDMKYDSATVLGLRWAGLIDLRTAYDWDPATLIPGVGEHDIVGLETPLWSETLLTRQDYEYLAFPRAIAMAELGWSSPANVNWESFRQRIGAQGARLAALGVNFARVPGVNWSW
jgi:hexosaminidase